ncbi:MAG TPA: hypothetical protein VGF67_04985 [Ktedonobacteraceae bacterium]|jgi:hypothetical protein
MLEARLLITYNFFLHPPHPGVLALLRTLQYTAAEQIVFPSYNTIGRYSPVFLTL